MLTKYPKFPVTTFPIIALRFENVFRSVLEQIRIEQWNLYQDWIRNSSHEIYDRICVPVIGFHRFKAIWLPTLSFT